MTATHRLVDLEGLKGLGELAGLTAGGALSSVVVCGRVVQVGPAGILLDDGSAARWFALPVAGPSVGPAAPGDFIALELAEAPGVAPLRLHLLGGATKERGPDFPPPDGEWYRLHRDGARRLANLRKRAALLAQVRGFFADRDFLEIEAPLLVPSPGLELHLDAFAAGDRYLITSPEYQLKRLLCGGLSRIYSLGKVFRRGEAGPHHNPEFTMLEWYRAYAGWEAVAADMEQLCAQGAERVAGSPRLSDRTATAATGKAAAIAIDLTPPWQRMTVAEAMWQHAGVRLRGDESEEELAGKIAAAGHRVPAQTTPPGATARWDDLFFSVFLDHVEPNLGRAGQGRDGAARPVILHDWPRPLCALARSKPGAPEVVERFEAYVAGLELCNGFGELCDPAEQRRRFAQDLDQRRRRGLPEYPIDRRFLLALEEGLPPSGGVALGIDRLVMLILGAATITDVLPFSAAEL